MYIYSRICLLMIVVCLCFRLIDIRRMFVGFVWFFFGRISAGIWVCYFGVFFFDLEGIGGLGE